MNRHALVETMQRTLRAAAHEEQPLEGIARVETPSGIALEEARDGQGRAHVALRTPDGELVLTYRPSDGVCRVHAPRVEIQADDELRLAARSVAIEGERGVVVRSGDTALAMQPTHLRMVAEDAAVISERTTWTAKRLQFVGDVVETQARRLVQRADEAETRARLLIERTKQSFREAEDLAQTKAGRVRMVAEDTFRALGRRVALRSREDMKLRGKRIYLD